MKLSEMEDGSAFKTKLTGRYGRIVDRTDAGVRVTLVPVGGGVFVYETVLHPAVDVDAIEGASS